MRVDIVINSEYVGRVIFSFDFDEALVVLTIIGADTALVFAPS